MSRAPEAKAPNRTVLLCEDEAIVAIVVPDAQASGPALTEEEVVRWCRERLATFRVPQAVRFRDELPRTAVGKIQKHILRRSVDLSSGSS